MGEEFQSSRPIYLQLVDRICGQIIRNERKPGDKLPSVREMALNSGVNPNTVQRTYSELERMMVVETRRGQGTFVTENMDVLNNLREELSVDIIQTFIHNMAEMGFTPQEMIEILMRSIDSNNGGVE
ncbi:GntR family transcriptional regulator [Ferdinandcohnia quinoae]|uniref:GntR family transcriptional regulator n=1 Tax=Fredinandcohnia quinoae TaxID=2918902 RepID=A0AAW5ED81_9BACI|nr:GntR family transcriptional regulator [Fredinandcohnia sp. SECRCQ15]MCH1627670.1 GntR family transcriptional regulator [Fredinandcohnia sp. SECRCQ15]